MAKAKPKRAKTKHKMKGWAVWNYVTGEFLGAGTTEDRAREFWALTRGPTTFGPCEILVRLVPVIRKGRKK